jgi:hypothetical protein
MDSSLKSYTQRCARIAAILQPYVQVSRLANTTTPLTPSRTTSWPAGGAIRKRA